VRIAVIPARGGSKRIPRKNVREFDGRPLIAYSIKNAASSGLFDRIVVSTDDDEVARVSAQHGAEVPFRRPASLADDYATTSDVMAHAVSWLRESDSAPTAVCCIYPTAPLMRLDDLRIGLELFSTGQWQYVFSAAAFPYSIFRSLRAETGGGIAMVFPEHLHTRSQDLPEVLHDAGQFYWGRPDAWGKIPVFASTSTVVRIPHWLALDLDTPEDWERLQLTHRALGAAPGKQVNR
jgi:pseudaminic acid cytidylyltransferase